MYSALVHSSRDMSVAVTFDKVENPTRLTNLKVVVKLPHGECKARKQAMLRVAEHCPVHETIVTLGGVDLVVLDRSELVPA